MRGVDDRRWRARTAALHGALVRSLARVDGLLVVPQTRAVRELACTAGHGAVEQLDARVDRTVHLQLSAPSERLCRRCDKYGAKRTARRTARRYSTHVQQAHTARTHNTHTQHAHTAYRRDAHAHNTTQYKHTASDERVHTHTIDSPTTSVVQHTDAHKSHATHT
jgi:hypothetical protein